MPRPTPRTASLAFGLMAVGTVGTGLHAQAPPAPAVAPGVAPAVSPDRGAADRVDSLFGRWNSTTTPGCAVAVARGGAVLLERAYGMADLERPARNTAATVFEAGSASKQFTAAAALLLVRDGKLGLDDPVRRHLPELPERAAQAGGRPATIRHLLSHTSGLRDWGEIAAAGGWPRGTRVYTQGDVLDIARRQSGLNFVPGSDYRYTNTGYTLLATVVERVSGESFAAFTRRRLFVPLGMAHTRWRDDHARAVPARALAYARGDDGEPRLTMPLENTVGHAGLLTTVGDLLRWNAHLERPDSAAGGPALVAALEAKARLTGGRVVPYGAGLFLTGYRGMREVSHGGSTAGYRAYVGRIGGSRAGSPAAGAPATGPVSVALLCNAADANAGRLAHAVADAFLPAAAPAVAAAPPATTAPADAGAGALAVRAGLYRDEASGDPLTVSADSAGLRIEGWTALVAVGPPAAGRFRSPGGEVEAAFDPGPPGRRATLRVAELEANGDTATLAAYRPTVPARPTPAALAAYVGAYAGPDVDATYAVAADGAGLALRRPRQAAVRLEPAYPDAFTAGGVGLVTFTRDAAGALTGLRLTLGRARGLAFARVARPADRRPGRPPA